MAVGPGVDVAFSSPTPIGHMDRVWWAGVAYSPKAPEWLVGVWTPRATRANFLCKPAEVEQVAATSNADMASSIARARTRKAFLKLIRLKPNC